MTCRSKGWLYDIPSCEGVFYMTKHSQEVLIQPGDEVLTEQKYKLTTLVFRDKAKAAFSQASNK
jgi:hypothetical protein